MAWAVLYDGGLLITPTTKGFDAYAIYTTRAMAREHTRVAPIKDFGKMEVIKVELSIKSYR